MPPVGIAAAALMAALLLPGGGAALELPTPGRCPPHPAPGAPAGDAPPRDLRPGQRVERAQLWKLRDYLPAEVWQRRAGLFPAGISLEIGPCQRRYPAPPEFEQATREAAGRARLERGQLVDGRGSGLPFGVATIEANDPEAGAKLAWSHRHRWLGGGLRGPFEIRHSGRRGPTGAVFEGQLQWQPFRGLPALLELDADRSLAVAGRFDAPAPVRGLAWRQLRPRRAERDPRIADRVHVWLPGIGRTRRPPMSGAAGLWIPDYRRAMKGSASALALPAPGAGVIERPGSALAATRDGFAGLLIHPARWHWRLDRQQDLVAPLHTRRPRAADELPGPWDVRRALLLKGRVRSPAGPIRELGIWIDAQTLAPLYAISRDHAGRVVEVAIHMGRFEGDDPGGDALRLASAGTGAILPVGQRAWKAGGDLWIRTWRVRSGPATAQELRELLSTRSLGR